MLKNQILINEINFDFLTFDTDIKYFLLRWFASKRMGETAEHQDIERLKFLSVWKELGWDRTPGSLN